MKTVNDTIRSLRIERGWTKAELSRRTGISQQLLCDIETQRRNPSLKNLVILAKCLNFSIDNIYLSKDKKGDD